MTHGQRRSSVVDLVMWTTAMLHVIQHGAYTFDRMTVLAVDQSRLKMERDYIGISIT
jgi:hypothetical protein